MTRVLPPVFYVLQGVFLALVAIGLTQSAGTALAVLGACLAADAVLVLGYLAVAVVCRRGAHHG